MEKFQLPWVLQVYGGENEVWLLPIEVQYQEYMGSETKIYYCSVGDILVVSYEDDEDTGSEQFLDIASITVDVKEVLLVQDVK